MELDEAAETLEVAGQLLDRAIPAYVEQVRSKGNEWIVVSVIENTDRWQIADELIHVVRAQGAPLKASDALIDALYAVAYEAMPAIAELLRGAA